MTPEQITLVQASFARLGPDLPTLATRFYQELFGRNPALSTLFTTDLAVQEVRFAEKLAEIVRSMPRLGELLGHTRALGARHAAYGVRAADYRTVGDALLAALAAEGMTSKDIAERLYLSVRTVNNHLQHAYAKLGVSSRAGLARALGSGP